MITALSWSFQNHGQHAVSRATEESFCDSEVLQRFFQVHRWLKWTQPGGLKLKSSKSPTILVSVTTLFCKPSKHTFLRCRLLWLFSLPVVNIPESLGRTGRGRRPMDLG